MCVCASFVLFYLEKKKVRHDYSECPNLEMEVENLR